MLAALLLDPKHRAAVWTGMLVWMGFACLLNARRCGCIHCRVTGPYLLAMVGLVVAYAHRGSAVGPARLEPPRWRKPRRVRGPLVV